MQLLHDPHSHRHVPTSGQREEASRPVEDALLITAGERVNHEHHKLGKVLDIAGT